MSAAVCLTALALPAGAPAAEAPKLAGTPVLRVASPQPGMPNTPTAWVTFKTHEQFDARLIVVRVHDASGRSYGGGRSSRCVRSTFVDEDGRGPLKIGHRYVVSLYTREGIGRSRPKTLLARFTLTARTFSPRRGSRSSPTCD